MYVDTDDDEITNVLTLKDVGFRDIREAATYFIDRLNSKENKKKVHPPKVICRAFVSAAIVNEFISRRAMKWL